MNANYCTSINESVEEYLQHLQDQTNLTLIPAVVMLSIFAITGLIGNILVLVVYSKKFRLNATKVLIMTIACFDLVTNVGAIPSDVNIMYHSWNFSNPAACKSKVFLGAFTTVGGALSLLGVAVIRYRKICRPYDWQVTIKQAIAGSLAAASVSLVVSIPYPIVYGIRTKETPCSNIKGYECFTDDQYFYTIWPLMNNVLFMLLYVSLSSSLVILYVLIGITVWRHHNKQNKLSFTGSKPKSNAESSNTRPTAEREDKRLQHHSQMSSIDAHKSLTVRHESATNCVCKQTLNPLICCIRQTTSCNCEYDSQAAIVMNAFTATNDTGLNEHSRESNSEEISHKKTHFEVTSSAEVNYKVTHSDAISHKMNSSEEMNPDKNTDIARKAASPLNVTSSVLSHQPTDYTTVSTTEALDELPTTAPVKRIHNPHELSVDGNCTHNKCATLSASNYENEQIPKNHKKDVAHNCSDMQQIAPKRESKSNYLNKERRTTRSNPLGRMTAMLIIISAIFVCGFVPYQILTILRNKQADKYASFNMIEMSVSNLFYRLYFVNSAANPIIYSLCNINFRRECIRILTSRRRL